MIQEHWGLEFHHLGLAVRDTSAAEALLEGLGYRCSEQVHDPLQKVLLTWCEHPTMPAIELIAPSSEQGPVDNLLAQHGEMMYHICFRSRDMAASIDAMEADGIAVWHLSEPKPAILFDGKLVDFYQVKGLGLVEILQDQ